jgi:hypothetical protein
MPMTANTATAAESSALDRWIQRVTLTALLTLAVALVSVGVALYGPTADANPSTGRAATLSHPLETGR